MKDNNYISNKNISKINNDKKNENKANNNNDNKKFKKGRFNFRLFIEDKFKRILSKMYIMQRKR